MIFHFYMRIIGKTTRELIKKKPNSQANESNNWILLDAPLFDPRLALTPV